jgi:hypothetical protein
MQTSQDYIFRILQNFAILLILITEYLREFTFFGLDQKLV